MDWVSASILDVLFQRIYEDNIRGKLSDERFSKLSKSYEDEQRTTVNGKVGEIAADVGATPQDWNSGVFNMLRNLSETVIVPIATRCCRWWRGG